MKSSSVRAHTARLATFLAAAGPLLRRATAPALQRATLEPARLKSMFADLAGPVGRASENRCVNIWEASGLGTSEVRVSAALAQLWDRKRFGAEGQAFLCRFLNHALGKNGPRAAELAAGYRISVEDCINGDIANRVDITVETGDSIFGIEVKIHAGEGRRQLQRYVRAVSDRAAFTGRPGSHVIYLSPREPVEDGGDVLWVTWRELADLAAAASDAAPAGRHIREFGQFCRYLGA